MRFTLTSLKLLLVKYKTILAGVSKYALDFTPLILFFIIAGFLVYQDNRRGAASISVLAPAQGILDIAPGNVPKAMRLVLPAKAASGTSLKPVRNLSGEPYIPPEAEVVVTPRDPTKTLNQVVNVKVIDKLGFTFEPGLDLRVAPLGLGLDAKFFYWDKLGLEAGFEKEMSLQKKWTPTVSLSYRLDQFRYLKNTELQLSYTPLGSVPAQLGIRINF